MERCEVSLPNGWVVTDLATVIVLMRNGLVTLQEKGPVGIPISRIETISFGIIDFNRVRYVKNIDEVKKQQYLLQIGDILFSHINSDLHLGKTAVYDSPKALLHGMNLLLIRPNQNYITAKYLNYFLNHCRSIGKFISIAQHSVNQSSLNQRKLEKFPIRIAPLAEQKRIVDKIERLFSNLDEGERLLEQVQKQISTYRQAVLKAALTGELTSSNVSDWKTYKLGELLEEIRYGTSKKCYPDVSGTPILRIPNITPLGINFSDLKFTQLSLDEQEKLILNDGDVLIIRSNGSVSLVGRSAVYKTYNLPCAFAGYLIRVRVDRSRIIPEFLNMYLRSSAIRSIIERSARSTSGVHNINSDEIRALPVIVPPLNCQREIIQTVEANYSLIDPVVSWCFQIQMHINSLRRSILKSAFSGELVDQDPNDEPASELLARIHEEQKQAKSNLRSGRTTKRSVSI